MKEIIKDEKSFAFQLRQSWYQHMKEESELFYDYQISRKRNGKGKMFCENYEKFAKKFGGKAKKNHMVYQDKEYSPWIDIVELWDYVEVENGKG